MDLSLLPVFRSCLWSKGNITLGSIHVWYLSCFRSLYPCSQFWSMISYMFRPKVQLRSHFLLFKGHRLQARVLICSDLSFWTKTTKLGPRPFYMDKFSSIWGPKATACCRILVEIFSFFGEYLLLQTTRSILVAAWLEEYNKSDLYTENPFQYFF